MLFKDVGVNTERGIFQRGGLALGAALLSALPVSLSSCRTPDDQPNLVPATPITLERPTLEIDPVRKMIVLNALGSADPAEREEAITFLDQAYFEDAASELLKIALNDTRIDLKAKAARILAWHHEEIIIEPFSQRLGEIRDEDFLIYARPLAYFPQQNVVDALLKGIREGGYGFKEPRDPYMYCGETLVLMGGPGLEAIERLLGDPAPEFQVAAAFSLSRVSNKSALPTLLQFARGDDQILKQECIQALARYPDTPSAMGTIAMCLAEKEYSAFALQALSHAGAPAVPLLAPYCDPKYFTASGIERSGNNPYLEGVSYGEIVGAVLKIEEDLQGTKVDPKIAKILAKSLDQIKKDGVDKLIDDLDKKAVAEGALAALRKVGPEADERMLGRLYLDPVRSIYLDYNLAKLYQLVSPLVKSDEKAILCSSACDLLAEAVRSSDLEGVKEQVVSDLVRENSKAGWAKEFVRKVAIEKDESELISRVLNALRSEIIGTQWAEISYDFERAAAVGISVPLRWSSETLNELIKNREATTFDGRKIATLVYPVADYNGAFTQHDGLVRSLIDQGYCVMYYEAASESEVVDALYSASCRKEESESKPAAIIILSGHAHFNSMSYGKSKEESASIDLTDREELMARSMGQTLEVGGQVILIACEAGEGGAKKDNLANMMRRIFSHAKEKGIWSCEVSSNAQAFIYDPVTRELIEVQYNHDQVYRS